MESIRNSARAIWDAKNNPTSRDQTIRLAPEEGAAKGHTPRRPRPLDDDRPRAQVTAKLNTRTERGQESAKASKKQKDTSIALTIQEQ